MVGPPLHGTPREMARLPHGSASEVSTAPDDVESACTSDPETWRRMLDVSPDHGMRSSTPRKSRSSMSWADLSETTDGDCLAKQMTCSEGSTEESGSVSSHVSNTGSSSCVTSDKTNVKDFWSGSGDLANSWTASEVSQSDDAFSEAQSTTDVMPTAHAAGCRPNISRAALAGSIQEEAVKRARQAVEARYGQATLTWQSPWHDVADSEYQMTMDTADQQSPSQMQCFVVPTSPLCQISERQEFQITEASTQPQMAEMYPMQGWLEPASQLLPSSPCTGGQCQEDLPNHTQLQSDEVKHPQVQQEQLNEQHNLLTPRSLPEEQPQLHQYELQPEQHMEHQSNLVLMCLQQEQQPPQQDQQRPHQLSSGSQLLEQETCYAAAGHIVGESAPMMYKSDWMYCGQMQCENLMWSGMGADDYYAASEYSADMCGNGQYFANITSDEHYSVDFSDRNWGYCNSEGNDRSHGHIPAEFEVPPHEVTTMMIRNIPNKYTGPMLVEELNLLGFKRRFNFVYVPMDQTRAEGQAEGQATSWNVGYAFVNFNSPDVARECEIKLTDYKFVRFRQRRETRVMPARLQGLRRNLDHYRRTSVQFHKLAGHRPLIIADGLQENDLPDASCFEHITLSSDSSLL